MLRKYVLSLMTILIIALSARMAFAQSDDMADSSFAGVNANGELVIFTSDAVAVVNNPANRGFADLTWNADGSRLAYIMYTEDFQTRLMVTDAGGSDPIALETGSLEAGFPIAFTPDGNILYMEEGEMPSNMGEYATRLMQIAPEAGAQPELLGTIQHGVGCGGGSILPADWQYSSEAGFGGSALTLAWTPLGILHSTTCAGNGLALFDPATGEDRAVTPDAFTTLDQPMPDNLYSRAALSDDGRSVLALQMQFTDGLNYTLVTIDLESGEIVEVPTSAMPDQVAWGPDGTVFYSSREQVGNLTADLSEEGRAAFEAVFSDVFEVPAYQTSIYQVDLATGAETQVHTGYAYAVGRMQLTADQNALLFTIIPNMDAWVAGIVDGSLNVMDDVSGDAQLATVAINLFELSLTEGAEAGFLSMVGQVVARPMSR